MYILNMYPMIQKALQKEASVQRPYPGVKAQIQ